MVFTHVNTFPVLSIRESISLEIHLAAITPAVTALILSLTEGNPPICTYPMALARHVYTPLPARQRGHQKLGQSTERRRQQDGARQRKKLKRFQTKVVPKLFKSHRGHKTVKVTQLTPKLFKSHIWPQSCLSHTEAATVLF